MRSVLSREYAYCLGLLLSLILPPVQAQPTPFEGANVILITTDLADKEAYIAAGRVLTEQNIPFSAGDDCLLMILPVNTGEMDKKTKFVGQLAVNAGLVKLTGSMQSTPDLANNQPMKITPLSIGYAKDKRKVSFAQEGFLYLNEIAAKLCRPLHGIISYRLQVPPTKETTGN